MNDQIKQTLAISVVAIAGVATYQYFKKKARMVKIRKAAEFKKANKKFNVLGNFVPESFEDIKVRTFKES